MTADTHDMDVEDLVLLLADLQHEAEIIAGEIATTRAAVVAQRHGAAEIDTKRGVTIRFVKNTKRAVDEEALGQLSARTRNRFFTRPDVTKTAFDAAEAAGAITPEWREEAETRSYGQPKFHLKDTRSVSERGRQPRLLTDVA